MRPPMGGGGGVQKLKTDFRSRNLVHKKHHSFTEATALILQLQHFGFFRGKGEGGIYEISIYVPVQTETE
jgi:hypothetical protein